MDARNTPADQTIGANRPPLVTAEQLAKDFAHLENEVAEIEALLGKKTGDSWEGYIPNPDTPFEAEDDADAGVLVAHIKTARAKIKKLTALRAEEKDPYLRAGDLVFASFTKYIDRLKYVYDRFDERNTTYLADKAAKEQAKRDKAAKEAHERAEEAARVAAKAESDRLAAIAAKDPQAPPAPIEGSSRQAMLGLTAARTSIEASNAASAAAVATKRAAAKPADMARTRTDAGTATLRKDWVFVVHDTSAIDFNLLRGYFTEDMTASAIRKYIGNDLHLLDGKLKPNDGGLPGVTIFEKPRGQYR
jgi:colicin import membrane protein